MEDTTSSSSKAQTINDLRVPDKCICTKIKTNANKLAGLPGFSAVGWEEVFGAQRARDALVKAVLAPIKFPHLCSTYQPARCCLLFGVSKKINTFDV